MSGKTGLTPVQKQAIVGAFAAATDEQQATMLKTIPVDLLKVDGPIYKALSNSLSVWYAYATYGGPEVIKQIPAEAQEKYLLPLLSITEYDDIAPLLLAADVFVNEALANIIAFFDGDLDRHDLNGSAIWGKASSLQVAGEQVLPVIVMLLLSAEKRRYAFHAFDMEKWTDPQAIAQLCEALYQAVQLESDKDVVQQCCRNLARGNPSLVLEYAITQLASGRPIFHLPIHRSQPSVSMAASDSRIPVALLIRFITVSLEKGVLWEKWNLWNVLVFLSQHGEEHIKLLFLHGSEEMMQYFASACRNNINYPGKQVVVNATAKAMALVLSKSDERSLQIAKFLECICTSSFFSDAQIVAVLKLLHTIKPEETGLTNVFNYPQSSVEQIWEFLKELPDLFKAHAALEIIRRTSYSSDKKQYEYNKQLLIEAITVAAPFFGATEYESSSAIYSIVEVLSNIHFEIWATCYDKITATASPFWRACFAIIRLKSEPNNQEAAEVLAQLMLLENRSIQRQVSRFFDNA